MNHTENLILVNLKGLKNFEKKQLIKRLMREIAEDDESYLPRVPGDLKKIIFDKMPKTIKLEQRNLFSHECTLKIVDYLLMK